MTSAFAIESRGVTAGIVVAERRGYRFFAADDRRFTALDRALFRSLAQAERAVRCRLDETDALPGFPAVRPPDRRLDGRAG